MNPLLKHLLSLGLLLICSLAYPQTTLTIFADQDNTLYEDPAGATSNGAGMHLFSGRTNKSSGPALRRALLHFPISAYLPAGATVTAVSLKLNMSKVRAGAGASDHGLHKVLADWGEGTSDANNNEGGGASATTGDATWIHTFYDTDSWTTAGGDYEAQASATVTVDTLGPYTWSGSALVSDVQAWVDDTASNFGWILLGDEATQGSAKRFDSRENPDPAFRPQLTITYTMGVNVEDEMLAASLEVFPNPTSDWLGIRIKGEPAWNSLELTILDLTGRKLMEKTWHGSGRDLRWDLPALSPGQYMLLIQSETGRTVKKLLVN